MDKCSSLLVVISQTFPLLEICLGIGTVQVFQPAATLFYLLPAPSSDCSAPGLGKAWGAAAAPFPLVSGRGVKWWEKIPSAFPGLGLSCSGQVQETLPHCSLPSWRQCIPETRDTPVWGMGGEYVSSLGQMNEYQYTDYFCWESNNSPSKKVVPIHGLRDLPGLPSIWHGQCPGTVSKFRFHWNYIPFCFWNAGVLPIGLFCSALDSWLETPVNYLKCTFLQNCSFWERGSLVYFLTDLGYLIITFLLSFLFFFVTLAVLPNLYIYIWNC